jgi:thiosulfate sulfurtransferase
VSVGHLSAEQLAGLLAAGSADVVDIRDTLSFQAGHIPGAQPLSNDNLREFLAGADRARPLVVCCYHGHSSVGAAAFLLEQGFAEVYSLDGGFSGWQYRHPVER